MIGDVSSEGKDELVKYGADKIHQIKGKGLETYSPEGYAQALKATIEQKQYDYVFAGSTGLGKDFFPRLAGMFDGGHGLRGYQFCNRKRPI